MSPFFRLLAYVRTVPRSYIAGGVLTILYAVVFSLVPLAFREVVSRIEQARGMAAVSEALLALIGVSVVAGVLRFSSRFVLLRAARQIEYEIRSDFLLHLQRLPQSYFASHRTGDLMSRAVNDINSVRMFLGMGVQSLLQTPVLYAVALLAMLRVDWIVTVTVAVPYLLFIGIARFFGRRMHVASLAVQEQLGVVSAAVQENAAGVLVVRSYAMEEAEGERFARENQELYARQMRLARINAAMQPTIGFLPAFAQIMVLFFGGYYVAAGRLQISDLFLFYMYVVSLTVPTFMMGWVIAMVQRGMAGLERLGEVFDTLPSIRDRDDAVALDRIEGAVSVRGLTLGYADRDREPALDAVSFRVETGQTVGIVGAVGSGKSTLVSAIPHLIELPEATVFVDGVDVRKLPLRQLRSSIAMVPQDSFLFSTSIFENLRFGAPDAKDEEVREAARRAHVHDEIEDLPEGYNTPVGERGITLSGGQRQRIALARALLLDPAILILDDALSSVDAETEEGILKELRRARAGRTCFIVAHRISAVRDAHHILVLDRGRLVEAGTHAELLQLDGTYAALARRQALESELESELEAGLEPQPEPA